MLIFAELYISSGAAAQTRHRAQDYRPGILGAGEYLWGWSPGAECSRIFDFCVDAARRIRREKQRKSEKMVPKSIKMMEKGAQDEPKRAK